MATATSQGDGKRDDHDRGPIWDRGVSDDRGGETSTSHQEPAEAHPQQFRPNHAMYSLAATLFKRDPAEWKIEDIKTPFSSDGMAVLFSAFVDYAATTLHKDMTMSQRYHLARQTVVTAPETILHFFRNSKKARTFVLWAVDNDTKLPPVLEQSLCPLLTPKLITNEVMRMRMFDNTLLRSEQQVIINSFLEHFYPKSKSGAQGTLATVDTTTLHKYITRPGEIARDMRAKRRTMVFSPPKWYRLSIPPGTIIKTTPRRKGTEESAVTWQSLPVSRADVILKLGTKMDTLHQLPILQMKTTILSVIPRIFEDRLSQDGMIDTLKVFSEASREEILYFLEDTAPLSPTGGLTEPSDGSHTGYRHHLQLKHMDRKKKGRWDIPAVEVLIHWLHAIQSVLSENDISFAVASSMFTRVQLEQDIMGRIRPEMASALEQYISPIEGDKRLTRFDIWVRSSCENLDELLNESRYGTPAQVYKQGMKKPEYGSR